MSFRRGLIRAGRYTPTLFRPLAYRHGRLNTSRPLRCLSSLNDSMRTRIEDLTQNLHASVRHNQLAAIHKTYPTLVANVKRAKATDFDLSTFSPLEKDQFTDILDALAVSGRPFDLALVERILSDMSEVFGLAPTADDHTTIIHALIRRGNIKTIHNWLLLMPRKPGHVTPSLQHWHTFLEYCREQGELGWVRAAIRSMRSSGCKPTNASYRILIDAVFETTQQAPQLVDFASILDDMKEERIPFDQSILAALRQGYTNQGHHRHAIQIERMYVSGFPPSSPEEDDVRSSHKKLEDESYKNGVKSAVKLCKTLMQEGFVVSHFALTSILQTSTSLSDLHYAQAELGLRASVIHWSILIRNTARTGDVKAALAIYQESLRHAIIPDAAMVHPIIAALCNTALKPPDEADINTALTLYKDLVSASSTQSYAESSLSTTTGHSIGPDINVYNALLRAMSSSGNVSKYHPTVMALLDDMQSRGLSLDSSMTTTSLIVIFMRNSSSPSEAFSIYRRMLGKDGRNIDKKGYAVLLNTFCKLSFGDQAACPSLDYYFEIVKDMRRAGHEVTVEVYTILLRQLASLATRIMQDKDRPEYLAREVVSVVRQAHNHLTVDASLSPDTTVWNQLMDTYQRAGCFGEAYKVWEMMYLSGTFDNTSVSIILDACGYAGAWPIAAQVFLKLFKNGFSFNQKNWNAWLECLCRLGKLNEAVKIVCLEMGKSHDGVSPDEQSIRILLKFAAKTNQQSEVQLRIKRYLPDLWKNLPPDIQESI